MILKKTKYNIFLIVFFLAFVVRFFGLSFFCHQPLNIVDEQHYNSLAISILERGEFGWGPGQLTAIRPPFYPAFLALVYKIFGSENYNAVRAIQILLSMLSSYLVYSLAKKIFCEEKVAFLACVFFLFYPSLMIFNYLILTETLFIFLFLLALWFLVSVITSERKQVEQALSLVEQDISESRVSAGPRNDHKIAWIFLILAGVFWGLASLTRSVTYPLAPLMGLFLALIWPKKRQGLIAAVIFVMAVVLTLSPWIIRNYHVFGHFVAVDTMGGLNLYMGNYEHTPLHRAWAAVDNPPEIAWYRGHEKELHGLNEAEKQRWAIKKALEFMKEHPGLTALRTLIKTANFWQLERTIIAGMQRGYFPGFRSKLAEISIALSILSSYIFISIFGFSGLLWRLKWRVANGEWRMDWLILLIIFYFTAIHATVFGHSRYHLPLIPLLCIYAAYFILHFQEIWRNHRRQFWQTFIPVCSVFACFWIYDVFIGSKDKILAFLRMVF